MNRLTTLTIALLALAIPSFAATASWKIDPDHSSAGFKVRHMMIADVRGSFPDVKGTVLIDEEDISRSVVDVTIAAESIDTGVAKRDAHLRSADFFDVERYPTLTFRSKKVKKAWGGKLKVLGDLNLHGVTSEVELLVEGPTGDAKDPWGNIRKGARATTTIDRKDFGILWNATLDNGGLLIGDEVEITIDLELIKEAGAENAGNSTVEGEERLVADVVDRVDFGR